MFFIVWLVFMELWMDKLRIADGFPGQIMHVIPKPLLAEAVKHVLVGELYPSHIGWFPPAHHHYIVRPQGTEENILIYCVKGRGWFDIDGKQGELLPDQALLIPKNRSHSYGAADVNPWSIHWVHFAGEDSACYTSLLPHQEHVIQVARSIRKNAEDLFEECYGIFTDGVTHTRILFAAQALRHLLALLFYRNPAFSPGSPTSSHRSFDNIIEHMRQHIDGSLVLGDMARLAGFSIARFSTLFKAQTGFSPMEYYIRFRIQAACRLFDTTAFNVNEVASHVGYDDPYYFSRIFRKIMGMPPTAYRKAKKG
jgi:AraC family transcriptional regulator, arabinose operon regulatory protein